MSEQAKKRPWFQYHLSTAVVMMFVASGFLFANLYVDDFESAAPPRRVLDWSSQYGARSRGGLFEFYVGAQGWPLTFRDVLESRTDQTAGERLGVWYIPQLCANVAIALANLLLVAFIWERLTGLPRPRLHRKTTILLLCLAAVLLWVNCRANAHEGLYTSCGWPFGDAATTDQEIVRDLWAGLKGVVLRLGDAAFEIRRLFSNLYVSLIVLGLATVASEWLIRRKERRQ